MRGSRTKEERIFILLNCDKIIFISHWLKKRFFSDITYFKTEKISIIYHGVKKLKKFPAKKKQICFVGKLNEQKGYNIFGNVIKKILSKFRDWKAISIGIEEKNPYTFAHKNFKELGQLEHFKTLKHLRESEIAIIPSTWDEPLGRTSIEASSSGCLTIVSSKGGLPETSEEIFLIKDINENKLYNVLNSFLLNSKLRKKYQINSFINTKLTINKASSILDKIRKNLITNTLKSNNKKLKIINIYNQGIKLNSRLYNISIGKKITSSFILNGHDVIEISDRDFFTEKKYVFNVTKLFQKHLIKTFSNYAPDLIIIGHTSHISSETLIFLKKISPSLKIIHWNEDPLMNGAPNLNINKNLINYYSPYVDATFITTDPRHISKTINKKKIFFFPVPILDTIENLKLFNNKFCFNDVFFAMSHGVNRGKLKIGNADERELFLNRLIQKLPDFKFDFYGYKNIEPIWSQKFFDYIKNSKMALNLSRGKISKFYTSNRFATLVGNGIFTLVNKKSYLENFFPKNSIVTYKNFNDLIAKLKFYKNNDYERNKIAKRTHKYAHLIFNGKIVVNFLLDTTYKKTNLTYTKYVKKKLNINI